VLCCAVRWAPPAIIYLRPEPILTSKRKGVCLEPERGRASALERKCLERVLNLQQCESAFAVISLGWQGDLRGWVASGRVVESFRAYSNRKWSQPAFKAKNARAALALAAGAVSGIPAVPTPRIASSGPFPLLRSPFSIR